MDHSHARACVVEVIFVVTRRQQRIYHRDHRANTRRAKPRPNKLRTIGQHHQHAVLDIGARISQRIAGPVCQTRSFTVGPLPVFEIETDFVRPAFLEVVIEEVVRHVEALGKRRGHDCFLACEWKIVSR